MQSFKPLARRADIVVQDFDGEILIYDLREDKVFNLNKTSAMIWLFSKGNNTVSGIADEMSLKLKSPINHEFVWLALDQMRREKLLENESEIPDFYEGTSRRELIKRAGLASVVALPVIFTLIAPSSIHAQSCTAPAPIGCPCTANPNCSNFCCGVSLTCVQTGLVAPGGPCRVNCECASGNCPAVPGPNICA